MVESVLILATCATSSTPHSVEEISNYILEEVIEAMNSGELPQSADKFVEGVSAVNETDSSGPVESAS